MTDPLMDKDMAWGVLARSTVDFAFTVTFERVWGFVDEHFWC